MKKLFIFAAGLITLAGCTSNDFVGDEAIKGAVEEAPISFGFDVPTPTRASGSDAATALGNQFIIYGEKNEADGTAAATGNLVFQNYQVNYAANTANTTTSNTKNWEYVGYTHSPNYRSNITTKAGEATAVNGLSTPQTIKYWDYSASKYTFTAVSALGDDIEAGYVKIQKNTAGTTAYDKGYTLTLTANADPSKVFIADRKIINQGSGTVRTAENAYGGNVTLTFRNLLSQIRVAMYETIPGYTVTIDKFYYKEDKATPLFSEMTTEGTDKFFANVPNLTTDKAATLTVTYGGEGSAIENQPTISVSGATVNNYITLGTNLKANTVLGTTILTATFDNVESSEAKFTSVYPQEANTTNLKLKVDYTLTSEDTGETIKVTGATAEVPYEFLQWKPNFKYTYYFKISDNTNGSTGQGVTGLYPITFDALTIEAENGTAEYITTVSEPSITTFGVSGGKYVTDNDEYPAGCDIYASIMEGSVLKTPVYGTNVKVYYVTSSDATNFPLTPASVAESIAENAGSGTKKITATEVTSTNATTYFTSTPSAVTTVPGEDGVDISTNALKLAGVKTINSADTYYAIEYTASAAWTGTYNKVYKIVKIKYTAPTPEP